MSKLTSQRCDFSKEPSKGRCGIVTKGLAVPGVICCVEYQLFYCIQNILLTKFNYTQLFKNSSLFKGRYLSTFYCTYSQHRRYWLSLTHVNYSFHWEAYITSSGINKNDKVFYTYIQRFLKGFAIELKCNLAYHSAVKMGH